MNATDPQEDYSAYLKKVRFRNIQIALLLEIPLMPAGALLDYFVYPQNIVIFTELRLLCTLAVVIALLFLWSRWRDLLYPALVHSWYVLPSLSMAAMIAVADGARSTYYAGFNLIALGASVVMQLSVVESLFAITVIYLLYFGGCVINQGSLSQSILINNLYFITLTSLVVIVGNFYYNRSRFHEFVLRQRLSTSQRQLEESNLQLREMDETKSRFFSNISHELRTPLTLIMGPIETLKEEVVLKNHSDLYKLVLVMESNALRLLRMINELLALVRLEKSEQTSVRVKVELASFFSGLITSIEHFAKIKGVKLRQNFKDSDLAVILDQEKLEKIILNLLQNAIKFTRAGDTVVLAWQVLESELRFEVTDSGVGIAEEHLPHVFDRFWQANSSNTRKQQGVGIGLALVKELVESMQGTITVESVLEKGSKFRVMLPAEIYSGQELPDTLNGSSAQTKELGNDWLIALYRRADLYIESSPKRLPIEHLELVRRKRPLVLIAEDQTDMAGFIGGQLNKYFDVIFATDGQLAVDMTRQFKPDLLVLDIMMPEKDGFEVCQELNDEVSARGLPILVLTARADEGTKLQALTSGATDFLTKPFSVLELQTRCRNLVALSVLSSQVTRQNQELQDQIEQIKTSETRMVQHAKIVSLGQMSAGLIHEINNPLNYVLSALNHLKRKSGDATLSSCSDTISDIEGGVKRVSDLVSSLRTFSYPNPTMLQTISLRSSLEEACRLTGCLKRAPIEITLDIPNEATIYGNKTQLGQVWINLIQNALDAYIDHRDPPKCGVQIRAEIYETETKIKICDSGSGIPEDILSRIFDPFFTTKEVGNGMGLGLSICQSIVESYGGWLDVVSQVGQGTTVNVTLPSGNVKDSDQHNQILESLK